MKEKAIMWIVWKLPRSIIYWAAIRLLAEATTGIHRNTHALDVTAMDAIESWGYK